MKKLLFLLIGIFAAQTVFAGVLTTSNTNYINDLVGGRATGMAGAYTAISDDPSGLYYNPAGSVFAPNNQISISVNSYKVKQVNFKEVVAGEDYVQNAETFFPSFFGITQNFGNLKFGFSFVNINNEILDQDGRYDLSNYGVDTNGDGTAEVYPSQFAINYNITENTLLAGPSVALFLIDTLSVGVTVYGLQRSRQEIAMQTISYDYTGSDGNTTQQYDYLSSNYITEKITGIRPLVGIQYMPTDFLSFGLSGMFGFIFSHDMDYSALVEQHSYNSPTKFGASEGSDNYSDSELPTIVRFGTAYFPTTKFLLSADFIAYIGEKYYQDEVENTFNGAIGSEYYVTSSFPVRLGVFSNFANTKELSKSGSNQNPHVDLLGLTSSLSWETRNSSITVSGMYESSEFFGWKPFGQGQSQPYGGQTSLKDLDMNIYTISITGSAKY
jgi:hypothetical protein